MDEVYPSAHFGVLNGFIGFISGAVGLINIPIEKADNYYHTCIGKTRSLLTDDLLDKSR